MQYTDNEAALIGGLISNYFLRPAVSAALKDSYIHVLSICAQAGCLLLISSRSKRR